MEIKKYQGVIPAFYACYDGNGKVSAERVRALTKYLIGKGVTGLYVGGSSGECIYQSVEERKLTLENVMEEAKGKVTVIAHVACNNTADSMELAAHAQSLGVDAIASIPPIYFQNIGMIFLLQRLIRISSFIIFHSLPVYRLPYLYCGR